MFATISAPEEKNIAAPAWALRTRWLAKYGYVPAIHRWLPALVTAMLSLFALLGIWYGIVIPPFETPDEVYHYAFARHLAQGDHLPVQDEQATGPWQQEGSQAPLYYMLVGRLTSTIDQNDFDELTVFNPRSNMGNPLYQGNKNRMLYSAAPQPWRGTNLALHIGRLVSTILGVITLACLWGTARLAFPGQDHLAVSAVALGAVIPQFVFISASFSNDNMIITTAAATLFWLARLVSTSDDEEIRSWDWLVLGVLLGLAALSKLQGLGLWLLAAGTGFWLAWRRHELHLLPKMAILVATPAIGIAGWWYWRNFELYGDWTGMAHLVSINGMRSERLEWGDFWHEFRGLRYSFWGLFGWFNILLPNWFYRVMDWIMSLGALGFTIRICLHYLSIWSGNAQADWEIAGGSPPRWVLQPLDKRGSAVTLLPTEAANDDARPRRGNDVQLLAFAWLVLSFVLLLYWMTQAEGSQGRLIFPALTASIVVLVAGLNFWLRYLPRWSAAMLGGALFMLLFGSTVYAGAVLLPASYGTPPTVQTLPEDAQKTSVFYGRQGNLELAGISVPDAKSGRRYAPGEEVPVTLYLRTAETVMHDHELFIQLLDEHGDVLGNVTSHPGWGRHPTSLWQAGIIYQDEYQVRINKSVDDSSPLLARVYVGFVDAAHDEDELKPMVARGPDGEELTPFVAQVALVSHQPPQIAVDYDVAAESTSLREVGAVFGESMRLVRAYAKEEVQAGSTMTTTLLWEAVAQPHTDYVGFVHVLDEDGTWIGGFDRAPAGERYPTSYWRPADRIVSDYPIQLPPDLAAGRYELWAGLYVQESQGTVRLPVTAAKGHPVANDMIRVAEVNVIDATP